MKKLALLLVLLGCSGGAAEPNDAAVSDAPTEDVAVADASDAGATEAGPSECLGSVPLTYDAPTDRDPHQVAPPTLGPAGSIVKDPVYGTSILRLTDETTLKTTTSFRVANEFWGNDWSTDAKLFYIQASSSAFLPYTLDPKTLTAARVQDMANPGSPLAMPLAPGGFSRTEPTIFYGLTGLVIKKFDFATQVKTTVVDLTTIVPGATGYALGVQQGQNGLLAASFGGPEQDKMPYIVTYDPATQTSHVLDVITNTFDGKPLATPINGAGVHTFKLDASGRYLEFMVAGTSGDWFWDTQSNIVAASNSNGSIGWAAWSHGGKGDSYDWNISTYAAPDASVDLVMPLLSPTDKLASSSTSWQNSSSGAGAPLIVETMRQPTDTGPWRAWDGEVIAVRTDGVSSEVWRFAHNWNTYSGTTYSDNYYYLYIPRVSQNGWFVIFDSNWNGTLGTDATGVPRTDAFIVALPNPCGP
ncbi:MAG TPA: hypothetical protein VGH28_25430 [Polyangiaceae bacterium]|jgi:hypothetical protein